MQANVAIFSPPWGSHGDVARCEPHRARIMDFFARTGRTGAGYRCGRTPRGQGGARGGRDGRSIAVHAVRNAPERAFVTHASEQCSTPRFCLAREAESANAVLKRFFALELQAGLFALPIAKKRHFEAT